MKNGFYNLDYLFVSYKMADTQKTLALEIIFTEAAKVFGKDESQALLNKVFETTTKVVETIVEKPTEEATKVIETKVVEKKKKSTKVVQPKEEKIAEEAPRKNIGKMTQIITNKLKSELVKVGIVFSDKEEKEMTVFKKNFVEYVNKFTSENFAKTTLEKHIENFAENNKPASATTAVSTEAEETTKVVQTKKEEAPTTSVMAGPNSIAPIHDLTLKELQAIENIMTPNGGKKGVYWNADEGCWVTGPKEEEDEELTEKKFEGKTYGIGDNTGRIYEIVHNPKDKDSKKDKYIFVGFTGVGAFAKI